MSNGKLGVGATTGGGLISIDFISEFVRYYKINLLVSQVHIAVLLRMEHNNPCLHRGLQRVCNRQHYCQRCSHDCSAQRTY